MGWNQSMFISVVALEKIIIKETNNKNEKDC